MFLTGVLTFTLFEYREVQHLHYLFTDYRIRGVAQPGSASALGAEGRRFKSCLPDTFWSAGQNARGQWHSA